MSADRQSDANEVRLDSVISESYRTRAGEMHERFDNAQPFRHLVMDDFLSQEFARQLTARFPAFDESLALNEDGRVGAKCVHENLAQLGGPWRQLDRLIQTPEFLDWLGKATGIDGLLYDPYYFGGGTHENRHGQDLDPHVDFNRHPVTGWHRRLNLIVYLNERWQPEWGGAIEFHRDPRLPRRENRIEVVQPRYNRAVLFETTHWSWHGFERINLPGGNEDERSRKSVALYFYSRTRPEEELTPTHSTIYVDRPLPEHIVAGTRLSDDDFQTIERLLARRDQHIQRLYRYISNLTEQLESSRADAGFVRSLALRLRRTAGSVLRRLGLRRRRQPGRG